MDRLRNLVALFTTAFAVQATAQSQLTIPQAVSDTVARILPEQSNAGAAYLQSAYSPNLIVTADCQVRVVFFWESAGYRNSLGWFRYSQNGDQVTVLESGMLYPDVNQPGTINPGATQMISTGGAPRTFHAGDRVGFFIVADGWNTSNAVRNWVDGTAIPTADPNTNRGIGRGCYTTLPQINPEAVVGDGSRAQHVAMVRIPGVTGFLGGQELIVCGFEDLNRTVNSDDDFNDAVFLFQVTPADAIEQAAIAAFDPVDHDGDGVSGFDDAFPNDATRAYVQRIPANGWSVVAFEDLYPAIGDADYNDAVVAVAYTLVTDRRNKVKDLIGDFHLLARGASYDGAFGLHLDRLTSRSSTGTLRVERFVSSATTPTDDPATALVIDTRTGVRIDGIFASTQQVMPRAVPDKPFANTWPGHPMVPAASTRVWITFDNAINTSQLGAAPYDPFLFVTSDTGVRADVHLSGFYSFADRSAGLPTESGSSSFIDGQGNPFALQVPANWRFPMEGVPITVAYPDFGTWRDSRGSQKKTWYSNPTSDQSKLSVPIDQLIPNRAWTMRGPGDRF
ncbi:MAG: LruC domain-containing protein [Planctomycetota bacterium]